MGRDTYFEVGDAVVCLDAGYLPRGYLTPGGTYTVRSASRIHMRVVILGAEALGPLHVSRFRVASWVRRDLDGSGNQHGYCCPDCTSSENIRITAVQHLEVLLMSDGTDDKGGDIEWTPTSPARCSGCGWRGAVGDLLITEDTR